VAKGPDKLRQLDQASRLLPPEIPSGPRALRHVGLEVWWMAALVAVEAAWALVCTDLSLTLFWAGFLLFAGTFAYLLRLPLARLRPLTREKGLHTDRDLDASAHLKLDTPGKVITICLITAVMGTTLLQLDLLPDLPLRAMVVGLGLFALGFCAAYAVTLFGGHLGSLKRLLNSSPLASPPDGAQGWLEGTIVDEGLPAPVDRVTWPALVESEATRRPRGALVKLELRDRHLQEVPERLVLQAEVGAVELAPERDKAFWASAALISIRAPGFFTEKARREMILAGAQVRAFGKILRRTGQPSRLVPAENGPLLVFAARPGHSVAAELRLQLARWRTALALFALAGLLQTMPVVLPRLEWGKAMVSKTPAAPR
jgi:hypothetical protein